VITTLKSSKDVSKIVYVVDAAGFFAGVPLYLDKPSFTVEEVLKEVKDLSSRQALDLAVSASKIRIGGYTNEDVRKVIDLAKELGEYGRLSKSDIALLALTHNLLKSNYRVVVISDDRSVQNIALKMGADTLGIKRKEIKKPRRYVYVCKSCGYVATSPGTCPNCGIELTRKNWAGE